MTIFLKANARPPLEHPRHRLIDNVEIGVRVIEKLVISYLVLTGRFSPSNLRQVNLPIRSINNSGELKD